MLNRSLESGKSIKRPTLGHSSFSTRNNFAETYELITRLKAPAITSLNDLNISELMDELGFIGDFDADTSDVVETIEPAALTIKINSNDDENDVNKYEPDNLEHDGKGKTDKSSKTHKTAKGHKSSKTHKTAFMVFLVVIGGSVIGYYIYITMKDEEDEDEGTAKVGPDLEEGSKDDIHSYEGGNYQDPNQDENNIETREIDIEAQGPSQSEGNFESQ